MPESVGRLSFTGENESYGSSRRGKQERVSLLAGRGRDRGGVECEDGAKRMLAELFAGAAEALRPQVVDGGDFAPVEGREGRRERRWVLAEESASSVWGRCAGSTGNAA